MKDDEELEMLLGEIPHATSLTHHHHHLSHAHGHHHHHDVTQTMNMMMYGMYDDEPSCISPVNGYFSSLFSNGGSNPPSNNPISKPQTSSRNTLRKLPENSNNIFDLSCNLSRMLYINQDPEKVLVPDHSMGTNRIRAFDDFTGELSPPLLRFQNLAVLKGSFGTRQNGVNLMQEKDINVPQNLHNVLHLEANEDSLILQGECFSHGINRRFGGQIGQNKKYPLHEKRSQFVGTSENGRARAHWSFTWPVKGQGRIFMMAKDQEGCRFLQKIVDKGSPQDVQIVFDEVIGHVFELMIDNFGNYLMQKLLEVCNEEQRMRILMMITREPREIVQISTRVVQKLIESLKTRQQVKVVISALEPVFLALINDLNGNHVIQKCLQCLGREDTKFIFEAAAKYCVEIATHQHGCCVLQKCIECSYEENRERLVSEISANGLFLAQDTYGNYVVQIILKLKIPSAISKLISQFEGNYVHLATQKFSSHVVEICLAVLDDHNRSTIVHELLSASHFEHLLQDPHANYVVQTALRVSKGSLYNALVNAIVSHKPMLRDCPYSKRIFSYKLLKR